VREIVGRLDKLPSIPDTYFTLTRSIENPTARTDDIARIVQRDPAMCVKVLQLVNSAYFGLSRPLSSVAHAIGYLGLDLLRGLALTLNVFAATGPRGSTGTSFERLQQTAILTARVAKQLVSDPSEAEAAFTAGLVHDIGTIILALTVPDRYAEITRRSMQTRSPSHVIEREVLGATHAEVGGYLLGVWGLPLPIVEAVAYHHGPPPARRQRMDTAMALYIGDALAGQALAGHDAHEGAAELDLSGLEQAGVAVAQELPRWRDLADREARAMLAREMNKREAAAI
jgi:HD-like signal output (HDOD) protein